MKAYREHLWLKLRRLLVDGELSAQILRLSKSSGTSSQSGLIMIQIDGLSKLQFEKAIERNEMPFLKKLRDQQKYVLHNFYTGVPSTTPAVQGELFYGVKQVVPAFYYFDRLANRPFRMIEWKAVEEIEKRLEKKGKGLLEGGSSYSNIYSGGAKETHFCASSLGISKIWKKVNPLRFVLFIFVHMVTLLRMLILTVWEIVLSLFGFFKGIWKRENLMVELRFIFLRVSICIVLRELIVLGARIDIARGLPIIHLNLLGFDEHAHHTGPSSKEAHNSLRGIDHAIQTIYSAALHSSRRQYDVWIYSDHGQDDVNSYHAAQGKTVSEAVRKIYDKFLKEKKINFENSPSKAQSFTDRGIQFSRASYLGHWYQRRVSKVALEEHLVFKNSEIFTTAIGPTAQVYVKQDLTFKEKQTLAKRFVYQANVPLVLVPNEEGKIHAWNNQGEFILPEQSAEVFGSKHPYLTEITSDTVELCRHVNAGEFTLCGLIPGEKPLSFPLEYGAHAGPGIEETNAFALLPSDAYFSKEKNYLTISDIRNKALRFLGRDTDTEYSAYKKLKLPKSTIRLMTYNVHSCVGIDGKLSPERTARVIARHEPDIVALQELDSGRHKTQKMDQPHLIAKHLEMLYHFHPAIDIEGGKYGNAILSRYPIECIAAKKLPSLANRYYYEPRGALWVNIKINNFSLNVINTHLGLHHLEANKQAKALLSEEWLNHPDCSGPVILCGDFNSPPNSTCWKILNEKLQDAQLRLEQRRRKYTWFSQFPIRSIDHIFVSPNIEVLNVEVPRTNLDQQASDHLPLIIDFKIV